MSEPGERSNNCAETATRIIGRHRKCKDNIPTIQIRAASSEDINEKASVKKRGRKTNAERLTSERARASSIGSIKEIFQSRKRALEKSWDQTLTEILSQSNPSKKAARDIPDNSTDSHNSIELSSPPIPLANSSTIMAGNMDDNNAAKILSELAKYNQRFDRLEGKIESQVNEVKMEQQAAMAKFQEELNNRDKPWKEDLRKVKNEIIGIKARIETPIEQVTASITEEMEKRVIEKVQSMELEQNPAILEMENKMSKMIQSMERNEKQNKIRNITISGLSLDADKSLKLQINESLSSHFPVTNPVDDAFLVGAGKNIAKVILNNLSNKELIMRGKKKALAGTNIYINPDLTGREAKIGKQLREIGRTHRNGGGKVLIVGPKIRLDENWWVWDDSKNKLVPTVNRTAAKPRRQTNTPGKGTRTPQCMASKNGIHPHQFSLLELEGV